MNGAVVRALAPCQYGPGVGPGSIPGPGVICGLSLLLVVILNPRVFLPRLSGIPPSTKTNTSKFQFDRNSKSHMFVSRKTVTCKPDKVYLFIIYLFIYLFIYSFIHS